MKLSFFFPLSIWPPMLLSMAFVTVEGIMLDQILQRHKWLYFFWVPYCIGLGVCSSFIGKGRRMRKLQDSFIAKIGPMNAAEALEMCLQIEKQIRSPCCAAEMRFWTAEGFPAFVTEAFSGRCAKCNRPYRREDFDWELKDEPEKASGSIT